MLFTCFLLASLALAPLASASSPHVPHFPRKHLPRSLPRQGRRLAGRQDATLKCLSRYTFALCDGARCTDMGSVAAGTACVDDAITWDDTSSSPSSSSASSVTSPPPSTSSPRSSAIALIVKAAATTSQSVSPTATSSTAASEPTDDDTECEDEPEESSTSASSTSSASSASSASSQSSSYTLARTTVQSTTAQPTAVKADVVTRTTTTASSASASSSSTSDSGSDWILGGFATYYNQDGGYGACGQIHQDSDLIVALQIDRYGTGSNNAPDCGRTVLITNLSNGKSVSAVVADACPGCQNYNSLDLSIGAFDAIADEAVGVVPIEWKFTS